MLKKIYIKNFALIRELEFYPQPGLNIITGETGAGKSIIINALGLILGQRADTEFLRYGENRLVVEGTFTNNAKIKKFLAENELDHSENELLIRREIADNGKNRVFINDSPVKLNVLQELGDLLIDFHGQHAHQSLFKKELHLEILDRFGGVDCTTYQQLFLRYQEITLQLKKMRNDEKKQREDLELANYHYQEIIDINPQSGEDQEIDREMTVMEGIEEFKKTAGNIEGLVYGDEEGLLQSLHRLKNELQRIIKFKPELEQFSNDLESAEAGCKELANQAGIAAGSAEFDEERYSYLSDRLNRLKMLKKKFGPALDDVVRYRDSLQDKLSGGGDFESIIYNLDKEHSKTYSELLKEAEKISEQRKKASELFWRQIEMEFNELGLKNCAFQVVFTANELPEPEGLEKAEFFIRTNVGSTFSPLIKTASGGEISRVMLAIKTIISSKEEVNVLVFDEIDTGISGAVAEKVGSKMEKLAAGKQIFVITHLPVIAGRGENHFRVEKKVPGGQTETLIEQLTREERVSEIAAMIGGESALESAKAGARELLGMEK